MEIEQVKSNVKKMITQGATEQEVDQYIGYKGVTAEQLRAHKNQPQQEKGMLEGALETVGDVAHTVGEYSGLNAVGKFAKDSYVGKQDPQYQDLEGFSGNGIHDMKVQSQIARGKVSTITDKGFAGVIKKALGDRLVNTTKDKHGQEIISYKNDDGEIVQEYINKPGFDYQDIDRVAESAVPFVLGGGLAGSMAMGMGLMGRAAVQGATAVGVDGVLQNQAQKDGSGEDYSVARTALAGLGGAGGEVAGTILTKLFNGRGLVDKTTGKLTEKGRAWAKANKVDPDALNSDVQSYVGQNIPKAADPDELAVQARAMEFDIPTSKAQRTKSYDDAYTELQIEKGQRTASAEKVFKNFKEEQRTAIDSAATDKVGNQLAPKARVKEAEILGEDIKHGLNEIHSRSKSVENKMWSEIGPMYPKNGAFKTLPDIVNARVQKAGISPVAGLTDASNDMTRIMQKFMTGDLRSESMGVLTKRSNDNVMAAKGSLSDFLLNTDKKDAIPAVRLFEDYNAHRVANGLPENSIEEISEEILKAGLKPKKMAGRIRYDLTNLKASNNTLGLTDIDGTRQLSIDEARRLLLSKKNAAQPGTPDARLANNLYEGFNEWIDDAAEKALIQADDPAAYLALKNARAFTREQRKLFAPRDKSGKLTLGAKKIAKIMDGADTPEGIVSAIFGRGSNVNELPEGTVSTLKALKRVMLPSDRAKAFDSVKMAYWGKLVLDKKGNVLSPTKLVTNIDTALNKHKSALKLMFSDGDIALIKRFSKVMKDLHVEHPNPSLTSIGMQQQTRKAIKGLLNSTQQRERLVKGNIFRANILSFISKYVDAPIINTGGILARQHTTQNIAKKSKNLIINSGGVGAVGMLTGANIEE